MTIYGDEIPYEIFNVLAWITTGRQTIIILKPIIIDLWGMFFFQFAHKLNKLSLGLLL